MNHWYTAGRLGQEHQEDLQREANRSALAGQMRTMDRATSRARVLDAVHRLVFMVGKRRPGTTAIAATADQRLSNVGHDA